MGLSTEKCYQGKASLRNWPFAEVWSMISVSEANKEVPVFRQKEQHLQVLRLEDLPSWNRSIAGSTDRKGTRAQPFRTYLVSHGKECDLYSTNNRMTLNASVHILKIGTLLERRYTIVHFPIASPTLSILPIWVLTCTHYCIFFMFIAHVYICYGFNVCDPLNSYMIELY